VLLDKGGVGGLFVMGLEIESGGIDAASEVCWCGPIVENVAEVGVATAAEDFGALDKKAVIRLFLDVFFCDWGVEAWPAGAGVELGL